MGNISNTNYLHINKIILHKKGKDLYTNRTVNYWVAVAKELGPKSIRVNCVFPGMINTTFHNTFTKTEVRTNVAASTPLRREGKAEEVGDLILYLASDASSFINGESVEINGGTYFA